MCVFLFVCFFVCLFVCFFFLKKLSRFSFISLKIANIGELPYGVLATAPKFGLREEIELVRVFTSCKQRRKRKFNVVFVQVLKKSALHVQNLLFFIYLLGSFRLTLSLPSSPPSLLPGFIDVHKRLGTRTRF